jgi:predicted PurR-regulated permease PerM
MHLLEGVFMRKVFLLLSCFLLSIVHVPAVFGEGGFTQADRERLVRLEATLQTYMQQNDKRLDDLQRSVDQRLSDMQHTTNQRFDQMDKRLEFMQNLMIGMLAVFGSLCGVFVGLLLWDRKTFKEKAKEEALKELEEKWRISAWIEAFRTYARGEPRLAEILKGVHLL